MDAQEANKSLHLNKEAAVPTNPMLRFVVLIVEALRK